MKLSRTNIALFLFCSALLSCGKKEPELSPEQVQQKADSLYKIELKKLQQQGKEDLDKRLSIEIKAKVDSIRQVNAEIAAPPTLGTDHIADSLDTTADSAK